jgi:hypothetical protein
MNFIRISGVILFLAGLSFFMGCKKAVDSPFSEEYVTMMKENALIQAAFDDVLKVAENILMKNGDAKMSTTGAPLSCYADIDTVITGVNRKHYEVKFKPGCTSYDGQIRMGKILFDLHGANYNDSGAVLVVTFENYSVDFNIVHGKMIVKNRGHKRFDVQVCDHSGVGYASLDIFFLKKKVQWKSMHSRVITVGNADNIIINNKYLMYTPNNNTLTFEGITSENKHYSAYPSTPLQLDYSCPATGILRYPVTGSLQFNMNENYRLVNYGDTSVCNKTARMIFDNTGVDYELY